MKIPGRPQRKWNLQMCREFKGQPCTGHRGSFLQLRIVNVRYSQQFTDGTSHKHTACSQPTVAFPLTGMWAIPYWYWYCSPCLLIILTTACLTKSALCSYLWAERQSNSTQRQEGTTGTKQWLNVLEKLSPDRRFGSFWLFEKSLQTFRQLRHSQNAQPVETTSVFTVFWYGI